MEDLWRERKMLAQAACTRHARMRILLTLSVSYMHISYIRSKGVPHPWLCIYMHTYVQIIYKPRPVGPLTRNSTPFPPHHSPVRNRVEFFPSVQPHAEGWSSIDPWHSLNCCTWSAVLPHQRARRGGEWVYTSGLLFQLIQTNQFTDLTPKSSNHKLNEIVVSWW